MEWTIKRVKREDSRAKTELKYLLRKDANKDAFLSACAAAYLNGRAGDVLKKRFGYGYTASQVLWALPELLAPYWPK